MAHGTPDLMPVLSRGKHRNPRKGACFMELASYLAGETWSDHPRCTHALLASLARDINDHVSDAARSRLAPLIPEVIGLTGDDPRVDAWIAREAALAALPVTAAERQGVAAVGLLRCERVLATPSRAAPAPRRPAHARRRSTPSRTRGTGPAGSPPSAGGARPASPSAARRRSCTRPCPASPRRSARPQARPRRRPGRPARAHDHAVPRRGSHARQPPTCPPTGGPRPRP